MGEACGWMKEAIERTGARWWKGEERGMSSKKADKKGEKATLGL